MSEISAEDLEAYKKFEWERAVETWGYSLDNHKNGRHRVDLLAEVRDVLGYSVEKYPCTDEELKVAKARYKKEQDDRLEADRVARIQAKDQKLKEKQDAWDRLTTEEQSAQLKQLRKDEIQKFAFFAISGILIISGIIAYYVV